MSFDPMTPSMGLGPWKGGGAGGGVIFLPTCEPPAICRNLPGYGSDMKVYDGVFAAHLWDSGDMSQFSQAKVCVRYVGAWCCIYCPPVRRLRYVVILPQAMAGIWMCILPWLLPTFETLAIYCNPPRLWVRNDGVWCRFCCPPLRLWRYVAFFPQDGGWDMKVNGAVFAAHLWDSGDILQPSPRLFVGYEGAWYCFAAHLWDSGDMM